jgi:hypothetical protein
MKKLSLLILALLIAATTSPAKNRHWKAAKVEVTSETDVSSKLLGDKNTMHYTIETEDMIYFVEYSYNPDRHTDSHGPAVAVNELTQIAIEGRHAYVLDVTGKEVKMHISKKIKR